MARVTKEQLQKELDQRRKDLANAVAYAEEKNKDIARLVKEIEALRDAIVNLAKKV